MALVKRFEIYLLNLDRNPSSDAKLTRPCVVISPDEMNRHIKSVIVAPIDSSNKEYPTRIRFEFLNKERFVVLDQVRTVDKDRLVKKVGVIDSFTQEKVLESLREIFAE